MPRKPSQPERNIEPPEADDLKLIYGIGPAVEQRLHGVGIYTFARLAALSPADIAASVADLAGLTAERILKQDWIGQARRLAEKSEAAGQQEVNEVSPASEYADELPETDSQQGIEIPALTALPESVFSGIAFTQVSVTVDEQVPAGEPIEPVAPLKRLRGVLHLRDLEMLEAGSKGYHNFLFSRQPFEVQLTLDLTEVVIPEEAALAWTASVYGKTLDKRSRLLAGQAQGIFQPADTASIKVHGNVLPQGIYRLEAIVTLTQTVSGREVHPGLTAQLEERLLQFC